MSREKLARFPATVTSGLPIMCANSLLMIPVDAALLLAGTSNLVPDPAKPVES
jgi:hypothetical protein